MQYRDRSINQSDIMIRKQEIQLTCRTSNLIVYIQDWKDSPDYLKLSNFRMVGKYKFADINAYFIQSL